MNMELIHKYSTQITRVWEWIQNRLDISGDVVMLCFTTAVVYKLLHTGLTVSDATVYSSAVAVFGYSNTHKG